MAGRNGGSRWVPWIKRIIVTELLEIIGTALVFFLCASVAVGRQSVEWHSNHRKCPTNPSPSPLSLLPPPFPTSPWLRWNNQWHWSVCFLWFYLNRCFNWSDCGHILPSCLFKCFGCSYLRCDLFLGPIQSKCGPWFITTNVIKIMIMIMITTKYWYEYD